MKDLKTVRVPIALNIIGGFLAEEGSPIVFIPLNHELEVFIRYGKNRVILGEKARKLVNYHRLCFMCNLLAKYADKSVEVLVENLPISLRSTCHESAILAALANFLDLEPDLIQNLIERNLKGAERGLLAGATICSFLRQTLAYRIEEGYVEFNNSIADLRMYIIGYGIKNSIEKILSNIRRLKREYARVYEPLFHAMTRLSIEVVDSLKNGDLYSLSKLLRLGHKILSAGEIVNYKIDELILKLEMNGLWGKLLEDNGQYIFTLADNKLGKESFGLASDLEVYELYVL